MSSLNAPKPRQRYAGPHEPVYRLHKDAAETWRNGFLAVAYQVNCFEIHLQTYTIARAQLDIVCGNFRDKAAGWRSGGECAVAFAEGSFAAADMAYAAYVEMKRTRSEQSISEVIDKWFKAVEEWAAKPHERWNDYAPPTLMHFAKQS